MDKDANAGWEDNFLSPRDAEGLFRMATGGPEAASSASADAAAQQIRNGTRKCSNSS
jgi:hypothetical protein